MIWKKKKQRLLAVFHRTWYELNIKCQKLLSKLTKTSMAITMCKHSLMYYLLLAWQEGRLGPCLHDTGQIWDRSEIHPFLPVYTQICRVGTVRGSQIHPVLWFLCVYMAKTDEFQTGPKLIRYPVWKVCIARGRNPPHTFDAFYIFTIKFSKSPPCTLQTFQSGPVLCKWGLGVKIKSKNVWPNSKMTDQISLWLDFFQTILTVISGSDTVNILEANLLVLLYW
jgi:hypothetical protein